MPGVRINWGNEDEMGRVISYDLAVGASVADLNNLLVEREGTGRPVTLGPGVFTFPSYSVWRVGTGIVGAGQCATTIKSTFTGAADDQNSALIRPPTVAGSTIGTVTARVLRGSTVIPLSSVAGLAVGDWLEIYGIPGTDEADLASLNETVHRGRIAAINGLNVTLSQPTRTHLASGFSAREVSGVGSFVLADLTLDGSAATALAVGIDLPYAHDVKIERVAFKGFSRAGVGVRRGATDVLVSDCLHLGRNNALVYADAAHGLRVTGTRTAEGDVERFHPQGVTRFAVIIRGDCDGPVVDHNEFRRWSGGVEVRMAHNAFVGDNLFVDCVPDEARARMITAGEATSGVFGILQTGSPVLTLGGNAVGLTVARNKVMECSSALGEHLAFAMYLHDLRALNASGNTLVAQGGANVGTLGGILNRDSTGVIRDTAFRGMASGITTTGTFGADIRGVLPYDVASGEPGGSVNSITFRWDVANAVRVEDVVSSSSVFSHAFGTPLNAATKWENIEVHGVRWARVRVAYNKTGGTLNHGDVAAIDNTGSEHSAGYAQLKVATGAAGEELVVVVEGQFAGNNNIDGSLMLVAYLAEQSSGAAMVRAADTIRPGDMGTVDAAGSGGGGGGKYLKKDNAPGAGVARVRFTGRKSGVADPAMVEFTSAL